MLETMNNGYETLNKRYEKLSNRNIRNFQSIHDKLFTTNITALNRDIKTLNNEYKNFQPIREKL